MPDEDFPATIFSNLKITPGLDEALRISPDHAVLTNREMLVIKPDLSLYWFQQLHQQMLKMDNLTVSRHKRQNHISSQLQRKIWNIISNQPDIRGAIKEFTVASISPPENPIMPRNAIAAMDEVGQIPTWAISPTISMSNPQEIPPKNTGLVTQ